MGKPTGFIELPRSLPKRRPVDQRLQDWREVYEPFPEQAVRDQGARCMDCGVPFCNSGCPLGNIIPEWNDFAYRGRWAEALDRLAATNNFPEFTGRLCPAPCENACVLGINADPVTIKQIEVSIIERAFAEGRFTAKPPAVRTEKKVAVIGSGPAGLAAADNLNRAGHGVTVFERADRIGGLLRYGIPEFKMEKAVLDRRLKIMEAEGVVFKVNANVGVNVSVEQLRKDFDALLLAGGATWSRDLKVPGRELKGIHFAMEFLPLQNKRCHGDNIPDEQFITAKGKKVIILGGGDTGADCLGTCHRQGCASVHQYEILPRPPEKRAPNNPWPQWANIYRTNSASEEGGIRDYAISTKSFSGENGVLKKIHAVRVEWIAENGKFTMKEIPGTEFTQDADLVLLALGFLGPERPGMIEQLGVKLNERGNVVADVDKATSVPGVFAAGDMARGQSLIVWAIAEGRFAARGIDKYLMGSSDLPTPDYR
jgi:glutamate synthase (NADPH/NADH) small chain